MKTNTGIIMKNGRWRASPSENNYNRKRIIDENLLEYISVINMMDKHKEIVREYTSGANYKQLGEKYGLSHKTIPSIISRYVIKARNKKRNRYRFRFLRRD